MARALRIAARAGLLDVPNIVHQLMLFCSSGLIAEALLVRTHCPPSLQSSWSQSYLSLHEQQWVHLLLWFMLRTHSATVC